MTARKPSALKLLSGTFRPDRARNEPQPPVGATPPPYLPSSGPARAAWDRLAPGLIETRVLTEADAEALAIGCMALAEFLSARRRKAEWRRADSAWKRYTSILKDFGLTPASRTRVAAVPASPSDPLAEWERKP